MTALATPTRLAVHRSRKLIPEFRLHRPRSAAEAVAMKAAAGPGAVKLVVAPFDAPGCLGTGPQPAELGDRRSGSRYQSRFPSWPINI